jgi:hypothetical protein
MESSVIRHMAGLPNMVSGKFLASPRYSNDWIGTGFINRFTRLPSYACAGM